MGKDETMCDYKAEEHKMTQADVRRVAREIVWNNTPSAIAEDAGAITSAHLSNTPYGYNHEGMYWQPDANHAFNDYHQVTDGQFSRLVEEVDKQAQRVSKTLGHPTTNPGVMRDRF
jgi:hypothetical protein